MVYGTQGNVTTTNKLPKNINDLGNVHTWWAWVQKEDLGMQHMIFGLTIVTTS
jgi:hypothetical protein